MTPESFDRLRALLEEERELELRMSKVRTQIAPLKLRFTESEKTYGLTNAAVLQRLTHKD